VHESEDTKLSKKGRMNSLKLRSTLTAILLGAALGFTGVVAPLPANHDVAAAAWTQSRADQVIAVGKKYWGTPYKFGSSKYTTRTFDCSSFVQRVFREAVGVQLKRSSRQQATQGVPVSKSNLKKGDLIFFKASSRSTSNRITHVAIYAGNDRILHTYGKPGVTYSKFSGTQWERRFVTARRVL
jgi:lipoprotein Spr